MHKKVGLPEFIKMKHDYHLVDEISLRTKTPVTRNIPIEKINTNPLQPRKDMGDLTELTNSIREKGIIEPVIVRPKEGHFEIVAGERRYQAAKLAGMNEIPCIEHDIPDNEALELSIVENIQRKDLNVFEQAQSIMSLAEIYGYSHEEIAKKIGSLQERYENAASGSDSSTSAASELAALSKEFKRITNSDIFKPFAARKESNETPYGASFFFSFDRN